MESKINVSNPNAITYTTEETGFTILGGIRIDGLDRLRVTMRIEVLNRKFEHYQNNADLAALPLNHNLDLYNDVQVEKLVRKAAERLEIGTLQIVKAIADITRQLELYRLQQIEQQQTAQEVKKKMLTPDEREAAVKQLRLPGTTVRRYHNELLQSGYIKLQENKKKKGYLYEVASYEEYTQLQGRITTVLDEILQSLSATAPPAGQHVNGSMKRRTVKPLAVVSQ